MKKINLLIYTLFVCLVLSGCGGKKTGGRNTESQQSMVDSIAEENEATQTTEVVTEATTEVTTEATTEVTTEIIIYDEFETTEFQIDESELTGTPDPNVDIDLTVMSANMVFSQVNQIIINPDEYLGKKIKVKGPYYPLYYDSTGNYYHYIIITDALACCQNGIEFIWDEGSHIYPDEYPKENQEIVITGELKCYEEEDYIYYYLDIDEYMVVE